MKFASKSLLVAFVCIKEQTVTDQLNVNERFISL